MRHLLLGAIALIAAPVAANAAVVVTSPNPYGFTTYPAGFTGGPLVTFEGAGGLSGFTLTGTGYTVQTGTTANGAAPAISATADDTTAFLNVFGGAATLTSAALYSAVSLYWGSIDTYNTVELLAGGVVVGTITNTTFGALGNGDQDSGLTNRRVNITSTIPFNAVRFSSGATSFELDNVAFGAAVPEPGTWAMMMGGLGILGGTMRRRRAATTATA